MKKKIGTLFMIAVLLITFSSSNYADASYDTKASITFIEPEDEESSEGDDLEAGVIPGGGIVEESKGPGSTESTLPKTATNLYSLLLIGFVILFVGISFLIYFNRKEKRN